MESITTASYKLRYSVVNNKHTKIVKLYLTLPTFNEMLKNHPKLDITTSKVDFTKDYDADAKFQLKVKSVGRRGQIIELYYLAPRAVLMNATMNKTIVARNNGYNAYNIRPQAAASVSGETYRWVQASTWQFLTDESTVNIDFPREEFQFQFIINIDNKVDLPKPMLNNNFEILIKHPIFSDVIIKSTNGEEFHAHRAILAARSEVFKANFEHNTTEPMTNIIESPLETDVLREVLMYIYAEKVPASEMSEDLLIAADFYNLNELKLLCEENIKSQLTVGNVMQTLELADLYTAKKLERSCLKFINDNDAKSIIETDGWKEVKRQELFKSIAEYIIRKN